MKKQIKKLNLNKRTISNLNTVEMDQKIGGSGPTRSVDHSHCRACAGGGQTQNGNTCLNHNTCYGC